MFEHYKAAQAFRKLMEQPVNTRDEDVLSMQQTLISEEYLELLEAHCESVSYPEHRLSQINTLKELSDLAYVCYQYAAARGWDLDEALDRVHRSNLTKLDDDMRPIRREDGKILKSHNYRKPFLQDLV